MRIARFAPLACIFLLPSLSDAQTHPSAIAIPFDLTAPGFVTLVIDRLDGTRVRNLIAETPFPAGHNIAWWDGLDDVGRDIDAARHSIYHVPGRIVDAGEYRVRGLFRPALEISYLMTPNNPGEPPWHTIDRSSGWLANHTPPSAVLWLPAGAAPLRHNNASTQPVGAGPQILVSSYVTEGGSGLAWLDSNGKKLFGQTWLGGVWTAASQLARDNGASPVPGVYAYAAAFWPGDKYNKNIPEIRLNELVNDAKTKAPSDERMGTGDDRPVLTPNYHLRDVPAGKNDVDLATAKLTGLRGMAVNNGLIILSLGSLDRLAFIDANQKIVLGLATLHNPRGLAFDKQNRLLALSGESLLRFTIPSIATVKQLDIASTRPSVDLSPPETLIATGLDDPQQIAIDSAGNIFISEWGRSHQVKMFDPSGKLLRTIGKPGVPSVGPYDPMRMNHPNGLTIDNQNQLWVAETDKAPKRVSIWNIADGSLIKALYGPSQYGGGGNLDPIDAKRFFYADEGGAQEMELDDETHSSRLVSVYWRPEQSDFPIHGRWVGAGPQTPIHAHGRFYLTDCYTTSATDGVRAGSIWQLRDGVAYPVAAAGDIRDAANVLFSIFRTEPFVERMPATVNLEKDHLLFAWSDRNGDGKMQPDETTFFRPPHETIRGETLVSGVAVQNDLSIVVAMVGDRAIALLPQGFTEGGVPLFDAIKQETLATTVNRQASSGGGQALVGNGGWSVLTTPPQPFSAYGLSGVRNGKPLWSYPSMWPGLHASHIAPSAENTGEVIGTTRLLGPMFDVIGSDLGDLWAINGNKGQIYLFTADGLFVASLFHDSRSAEPWPTSAIPGMNLANVSLGEEDFGPTVAATQDGRLVLQVGFESNLVQVNGLQFARRLPDASLTVTNEELLASQQSNLLAESQRQGDKGGNTFVVPVRPKDAALSVDGKFEGKLDGKLDNWSKATWMPIDQRHVQVGNWGRRTTNTEASLLVAGDRLFGAVKADDPELLSNSGEVLQNIFKTGGAIDLMIGTDPAAPDDRKAPASGDRRLIITRANGKTLAVLYEQVRGSDGGAAVEFASPLRTVRFAMVKDISADVRLLDATVKDTVKDKDGVSSGVFEFSVPLSLLGLPNPPIGKFRGDIGVLRGNAMVTVQRSYWSNKASGLVSDLPSEAELQPSLWGHFDFEK